MRLKHTFSALAAYRPAGFNVTGQGDAERVSAMEISASFFPPLSVSPILGRDFSSAEDQLGGPPAVILSGISTGGRPISSEPGYKRQLKAEAFDCEESPATSRPLIRIVGDPENARSLAMLSSLTSTSRISAATPSESRTSLTNFHQEDITAGNNPQACGFSRLFSNRAPTPARRGNSL